MLSGWLSASALTVVLLFVLADTVQITLPPQPHDDTPDSLQFRRFDSAFGHPALESDLVDPTFPSCFGR